jgi:plasmid stabilization system protein ParE
VTKFAANPTQANVVARGWEYLIQSLADFPRATRPQRIYLRVVRLRTLRPITATFTTATTPASHTLYAFQEFLA